jgi:hypothetical protein
MSWLDLFCACREDLAHPLGFPHSESLAAHPASAEEAIGTPDRARGGVNTTFARSYTLQVRITTFLAEISVERSVTCLLFAGSHIIAQHPAPCQSLGFEFCA